MAVDISIIIPNNNPLPLLHRLIDSIPDRQEYEIIVVDNSAVPLNDHAVINGRNNVFVYHSAPSRGAGGARNEGLLHAKGKWLLFADADDFFTPDAFAIFSESLNSDSDVIYYNVASCHSDTLLPANRNSLYSTYIALSLSGNDSKIRYYWDPPWSKLVRTQLVRDHDIKFDECAAGNDMGFSVRIGTFAHTVHADKRTVYCVTIHDGSITKTLNRRNIESRFKAMVRLNNFLKAQGLRQYRHSIMRIMPSAWRCSPLLALRLLAHSIRQGNSPLIGCTRWLGTLQKMRHSKRTQP